MSEQHTPAPWKVERDYIEDGVYRYQIFGELGVLATAFDEANARRIVACVNACEGFSTESLELPEFFSATMRGYRLMVEEGESRIAELEAQIEELKRRLEVDERHGYDGIATRDETVKALESALHKKEHHLAQLIRDFDCLEEQQNRLILALDKAFQHYVTGAPMQIIMQELFDCMDETDADGFDYADNLYSITAQRDTLLHYLKRCMDECEDSPEWNFGTEMVESITTLIAKIEAEKAK